MFLFFSCSRTTGPRRLSISCARLCQRLAFHHVGPRFPTPGGFPVVGWSLIWWEVCRRSWHTSTSPWNLVVSSTRVLRCHGWWRATALTGQNWGRGSVRWIMFLYVLVCYCAMSHSDGAKVQRLKAVAKKFSRLAGECHGMVLRVLSE